MKNYFTRPSPAARLSVLSAAFLALLAIAALLGIYWPRETAAPAPVTETPDPAGREAVAWIKQTLPAGSTILAPAGLAAGDGPPFPNAYSYQPPAQDPGGRDRVLPNDRRTVDYLLLVPGVDGQLIAPAARDNASLVRRWQAGNGPEITLWKVAKVGETEAQILAESHQAIAARFNRDGAYVDAEGAVTSEAQAYTMLRAAWLNDAESFYQAWAWTGDNLMTPNGLPAWLWRDWRIVDTHHAADSDIDMALALLLGSKRWDDPRLLEAGRQMVRAIWERETVTVNGRPYLAAGDWAAAEPVVALNPSYFSPYAYHIFQEVDPEHDWLGLVETGYEVLVASSTDPLGHERAAGLPPNWVGLDRATGQLAPLELEGRYDSTAYGYDAARSYWRIALDWRWSGDGRAKAYLEHAFFLRDEVNRPLPGGQIKNRVSAVYAHDGTVVEEPASMVSTAGALAALLTLDPPTAQTLYAGQVVGGLRRTESGLAWEPAGDLYTQEWGWFATALYAGALPNLWRE